MRGAVIAALLSLALGESALAAERAPPPVVHAPVCISVDDFKKKMSDGKTHFSVMTAGQFHFAAGIYVGSPNTPPGMPPGDGAFLVRHDGNMGAMVAWTRAGKICSPAMLDPDIVKLIVAMKTGKDEDVPVDDGKDELHL